MKLIRCYVSSFGKLKGFSYDFNDNLNVIKQDNGWGKSTFATFIKCMFYGLNNTSKRSVEENERLKFRPWNSIEKFGGYVEFSWKDKRYKIERYFGSKDAEDTVCLTDLETGKTYENQENLGKRIFQIDEQGFMSTTYFSEHHFEIKSNTSITEKFNQVNELADDLSYDLAIKELDKQIRSYKYSGNRGIIPELKSSIVDLDEKIQTVKNDERVLNALVEECKILTLQVDDLKQKLAVCSENVKKEGKTEALTFKKNRFDQVKAEKSKILTQIDECDSLLNGNMPNDDVLSGLEDCYREMSENQSRAKILAEDLENSKAYVQPVKNTPNKWLAVTGAILIALCIGLVVGGIFAGIGLIIGGAISGVLGAILIGYLFIFAKKNDSRLQQSANLVQDKLNKISEYDSVAKTYEQNLDKFFSGYNLNQSLPINAKIQTIRRYRDKKRSLIENLNLVEKELENFINDKELQEFIKTPKDGGSVQLNANKEFNRLNEQYSILSDRLSIKKASVDRYNMQADNLSEYIRNKSELEEKLAESVNRLEVLTKTYEFLTKANENLKVKYRAPLEESLNKYLGYVSNNNNIPLAIDVDLNVTVSENNGAKVPEYYSKGTQDMFNICKRFALSDVLFKEEKPFMILDDPFYNLDDEKVKSALKLVEKLSKDYQILYLVCHNSRVV